MTLSTPPSLAPSPSSSPSDISPYCLSPISVAAFAVSAPVPTRGFGRETKLGAGLCGGLGTLGGVHRALHGGSGVPAREDIGVERRDWCFVKAGLVASSSENISGPVCAMFREQSRGRLHGGKEGIGETSETKHSIVIVS
jgi:hypothetical protein